MKEVQEVLERIKKDVLLCNELLEKKRHEEETSKPTEKDAYFAGYEVGKAFSGDGLDLFGACEEGFYAGHFDDHSAEEAYAKWRERLAKIKESENK